MPELCPICSSPIDKQHTECPLCGNEVANGEVK